MSKSTVVPPKQKLPKCQWRGTVGLTRCVCESPKILGRIVTLETCPGCPFANHDGAVAKKPPRPQRRKRAKAQNGRDCVHFGSKLREESCRVCQNEIKIVAVHECAIHGECALLRYGLPVQGCNRCKQFEKAANR